MLARKSKDKVKARKKQRQSKSKEKTKIFRGKIVKCSHKMFNAHQV